MIRHRFPYVAGCLLAATLASIAGSTQAARPLLVDDANTLDQGSGHVEMWGARETRKAETLNLAPAYSPMEGLELAVAWLRERRSRNTTTAVQGKWLVTRPTNHGCNWGLVLGRAFAGPSETQGERLNFLATCNRPDFGSLHLNFGGERPRHGETLRTWGAAFETQIGRMTPHVEWFGARGERATIQVGLRSNVTPSIQLDGTLGRQGAETIFSLGTKLMF